MSDYTNSKSVVGSTFPLSVADAHEWKRVEPLVTPQQLKDRFLFGIPLVSSTRNPNTGLFDEMSDELLKDFIDRAVVEAELETGISIFPVQHDEKHPFDMSFWRSYGYLKVHNSPIVSVEKFAFTPSNGTEILEMSLDWIEPANFARGQISLVPIMPASTATMVMSPSASGSGSAFLNVMSGLTWIPAIIQVKYTTGFPNGIMPRIVNELIGINAAIDILGIMASNNKAGSYSLGIDGYSQSVSTPGPQVYDARINLLTNKKSTIVKRLKTLFAKNIISGSL